MISVHFSRYIELPISQKPFKSTFSVAPDSSFFSEGKSLESPINVIKIHLPRWSKKISKNFQNSKKNCYAPSKEKISSLPMKCIF